MEDSMMTNERVVKALKDIKTYCSATSLDELDYAIKVLEKLNEAGVEDPLDANFLAQIKFHNFKGINKK